MLILNRPWDSQPQQVTPANPAWVERGLVALFDQRVGVDVVNGVRASTNTALPAASFIGVGADYTGTVNTQYPHHPAYATTGAFTIVALMDVDALSNYGAIIAKQGTTTTNAPYELRIGPAASADSRFNLVRASAGSFAQTVLSGAGNLFNAPIAGMSVIVTAQSSGIGPAGAAFINGAKTSFSATNATAASDNGAAVWIGRRYDGATQLDGRIYYVALFNRALNDDEAQSIYNNPWQLFEPRHLYIPATVSSGGGVTGTLSTTNAADTLSAVGSTTIVGTLARTNNSDSIVATGSTTIVGTLARTNANDSLVAVGSTTITGTLARTNNNDVLAATGSVGSVTGTLARTNANDSVVAVGSTTILGTLARTNSDDLIAANGVVGNITGTLARTNANDSVVANGVVPIWGTLAKTNANDILAASGTSGTTYSATIKAGSWIRYRIIT